MQPDYSLGKAGLLVVLALMLAVALVLVLADPDAPDPDRWPGPGCGSSDSSVSHSCAPRTVTFSSTSSPAAELSPARLPGQMKALPRSRP